MDSTRDYARVSHRRQWSNYNVADYQCRIKTLEALVHSELEAPLPQRNSASAAHIYLGWQADLLMITHSRLVVQCTEYGKIAEVALFFDIQTL